MVAPSPWVDFFTEVFARIAQGIATGATTRCSPVCPQVHLSCPEREVSYVSNSLHLELSVIVGGSLGVFLLGATVGYCLASRGSSSQAEEARLQVLLARGRNGGGR
jgi:hypothetical protein